MDVIELNMDGLVGPTHHYAGLATGNIASTANALSLSNPRAAALQGLDKMRLLLDLGLTQGFLPPQARPNVSLLHALGFAGRPEELLSKAFKQAPELVSAAYSASSMWAANTATVSPSTDTADNRVHFTPANLIATIHCQQEASFSASVLQSIFKNPDYFVHHAPLPASDATADEGAANHNRLARHHGVKGLHVFVYGKPGLGIGAFGLPEKYPARQSKEASEAIARRHLLDSQACFFAQQNPAAIDAGVFHNDVISVTNEQVFILHEKAFCNQKQLLSELQSKADFPLCLIEIKEKDISLSDAVSSYLFNSQLLTLPSAKMLLLAPLECQQNSSVHRGIEAILADSTNPVAKVQYVDLKQSMRNGGGPACLRLRIPLATKELAAMDQHYLLDHAKLDRLSAWVNKHYRDRLQQSDLADPLLMRESFSALDELTQLFELGSIYPFQQE